MGCYDYVSVLDTGSEPDYYKITDSAMTYNKCKDYLKKPDKAADPPPPYTNFCRYF